MRSPPLILLALLLSGCAAPPQGSPPLPNDTGAAAAEIQKWIPLGTPAAQAQTVMQQHGFKVKNIPPPADSSTGGYLYATASWPPGELLQDSWYCTLRLTDGKLSSVSVTVTMLGPAGNYQPNAPGSNLSPSVGNPTTSTSSPGSSRSDCPHSTRRPSFPSRIQKKFLGR